jgi:hypothetical protein
VKRLTGLDFLARGVTFNRKAGRIVVLGPSGSAELLEQLRHEVARRVDLVASCDRPKSRSDHHCDQCGDLVGHGAEGFCPLCGLLDDRGRARCRRQAGGFCELCAVARQKLELPTEVST